MQIDGFDWDAGNLEKCSSHGVSRTEIESLFTRPHRVTPDVKHSGDEERFLAIGNTDAGRPLFLVFTADPSDQCAIQAPQGVQAL